MKAAGEEGVQPAAVTSPETNYETNYRQLLQDSLSLEEVVERLGWAASVVLQALELPTPLLYGFWHRCQWYFPEFQFENGAVLPGWELVLAELPPTLDPVAVRNWLFLPDSDLITEADEKPLTPRDWLLRGLSPTVVARLASGL